MGGAPAATLCRSAGKLAGSAGPATAPKGLSGSGLHTPAGALFAGGPRSIHRQFTMCKARPGNLQQTNALPFVFDLTLALVTDIQPPSFVQSSMDEVVFQATLQVPAHHALACKLQAYGTPFTAPDLQATAEELTDADLEFAACLASPPDLEEQVSMNLGRMMSMLEQNRAEVARAVGQAAPAQAQAQAAGGGAQQAPAAAQQLRAGGVGQSVQQSAPKVLVSVDDAEAGVQQLQRSQSTRKTGSPQLPAIAKRAMQSLLGFGYLLTVLHEKHLGGHIQFTASAITGGSSGSTPSTGNSHMRTLRKFSSNGRTGGMLSGLRQMVRECPSLSPHWAGQQQQQQQQPVAAAAGVVPYTTPFSAVSEADNIAAAATGSDDKGFDNIWERINSPAASNGRRVRRLSFQLALYAPVDRAQSTALHRVLEQDGSAAAPPAATTPAEATLEQEPAHGHSGMLEQLLDEALGELGGGAPAAAAAGGSSNRDVVRSHGLADQGAVTSLLPAAADAKAPWLVPVGSVAAAGVQEQESGIHAADDIAVGSDASLATAAEVGSPPISTSNARVMKPMVSMRLFSIMSPKWQYNQELEGLQNSTANAIGATNCGQQQQQQQVGTGAGPVHSSAGIRGLWPTMSFSLAPVRLQAQEQQRQQQQPIGASVAW